MTGSDTPSTPAESDTTLEPLDLVEIEKDRLLFYLAGKVPITVGDLSEHSKQFTPHVRRHLLNELHAEVEIDTHVTIHLTEAAVDPVRKVARRYTEAAEDMVEAGEFALEEDRTDAAIEDFETAVKIFEQVRRRYEAIDYASEELEHRIETTRERLEAARDQESAVVDDPDIETAERGATQPESADTSVSDTPGIDDRTAMLELVTDLHRELGRIPRMSELPEDCPFTPIDFYAEFGSWDDGLAAAGIDKEHAMLKDIERVAAELDRVPDADDMDTFGIYSASSYASDFGSWQAALDRTSVDGQSSESSSAEEGTESLVEILSSLHDDLDRPPKPRDLKTISGVNKHDYAETFGSWDEALAAAGIDKEQALIDDVERVADIVGRAPTTTDLKEHGAYSAPHYLSYFDSWSDVFDQADIETQQDETDDSPDDGASEERNSFDASTPIDEIESDVDSLGGPRISRLRNAGYTTLGDLAKAHPAPLTGFRGIGESNAKQLIRIATALISDDPRSPAESSASPQSSNQQESTDRHEGTTTDTVSNDDRKFNQSTPLAEIDAHIDRISGARIWQLEQAGYTTLGDISEADPVELAQQGSIQKSKAEWFVEFARTLVSDGEAAGERLSNRQPSTAESTAPSPEQTREDLPPSAMGTSWDTIPASARMDGHLLIQVTDIDEDTSSHVDVQLTVTDRTGRSFDVDIWSTHGIEQTWKPGRWYLLSNARGKVWKRRGTTKKRLRSTADLEVRELDAAFHPPTGASAELSSGSEDAAQTDSQSRSEIPEGTSRSSTATSDTTTSTTENDGEDREESEHGIVEDIMSEFDGI